MTGPAPPGWPAELPPPGAPGWERAASGWLLDHCPGEYRRYELLRRHPVLLAHLASRHVGADLQAVRDGLADARAALREVVGPELVEATVLVLEREASRLETALRRVELVYAALRGERYVPRL